MVTTKKGEEVRSRMIDFIKEYTISHGYSPTIREIAEGINLKSTASIHNHLNQLRLSGDIISGEGQRYILKGLKVVEE